MPKTDRAEGKLIRRRFRRVFIILFSFIVILFVPLFPHMPSCLDKTGPTTLASIILSDLYVKDVTRRFDIHDINYFSIDGVIFLGLWSWLNDDGMISNSSWKSVMSLVGESAGAEEVELPDHIKELLASPQARFAGGEDVNNTCELVRAVAVEGW